MTGWHESPRCGRPNQTGKPCRMRRPQQYKSTLSHAPACSAHLTDEDRAAMHRAHTEYTEQMRVVLAELGLPAPLPERDPACWSWLVSEGMDLDDFQDGRCGACGVPNRRMVLDHDHDTGLIRGLLCRYCNAREGHASIHGDHIWTRYRRRNPATILGVVERYVDPIFREEDIGNIARRMQRSHADSPAYVVSRALLGDGD